MAEMESLHLYGAKPTLIRVRWESFEKRRWERAKEEPAALIRCATHQQCIYSTMVGRVFIFSLFSFSHFSLLGHFPYYKGWALV
jgi:hypothetical protein